MSATCCLFVVGLMAAAPPDSPRAAHEIAALIRLVEQADVPALEAGLLTEVRVVEGQLIQPQSVVAAMDDTESRALAEHAKMEAAIADSRAQNTVNVRFAKKSAEVARAELRRATESTDKYQKSISESEMDRLRLAVEKGQLEVEQAEEELRVAALTQRMKAEDFRAAQERVKRLTLTAPLGGVVVQVNRHRGEWVKPGDAVVRILRLDRLRAEGFLKMSAWSDDLPGRPVRLLVDLPNSPKQEFAGKVVFVDPEIDPVNGQVRIWAEVENEGLRLRPGMRATMLLGAPEQKP